jgi:hypothetical protein
MSERELLKDQPEKQSYMTQKLVPAALLPRFGARQRLLRVVAVEGAVNDWAAYAQDSHWEPEHVAHRGDKLSAEEAAEIFPFLRAERYRP